MSGQLEGGVRVSADPTARYAAWFHELDAWTEYWDIYHPETRGRFYFGDGDQETGLLAVLLPRTDRPPVFQAWVAVALQQAPHRHFADAVREPSIRAAVLEVDELVGALFARHFGAATDPAVRADYLQATHLFALDTLPPATERAERIPPDDHRARTAGRHTLDGDLMWFAWALHTEAAVLLTGPRDPDHARRSLMLAAVATGCPANFAWRAHRRTRPEYHPDEATAAVLRGRGLAWTGDPDAAADEIRALYRLREWGHP